MHVVNLMTENKNKINVQKMNKKFSLFVWLAHMNPSLKLSN